MEKLIVRLGKILVAFSFLVTAANINSTCFFIQNQPELPEESKKLRRF